MAQIKVLFVDDEISILNSIRRGIHGQNYKGVFAGSGKEALSILEKEEIAVIVTDMKMPEMSGLELLEKVKEQYPKIIRIVLSGYSHLTQILATVNKVGVFKYITKPWDLEGDFLVSIQQAVDYYNLQKEHGELKIALEKKNILYQNMLKSYEEKNVYLRGNMDKFLKVNDYFLKSLLLLYSKLGETKDKDVITNYVNLVKDFYPAYIESILSNPIDFNLEKLSNDMNDFLVKNYDRSKIRIKINSVSEFSLKGNYKLLYATLITLLKTIVINYCKDNNDTIAFSFVSEEKDIKNANLRIKIELITEHQDSLSNSTLNIFTMFLNEVFKLISGSVTSKGNTAKDFAINLQGVFQNYILF